jgi:hypothetical protein
MPGNPQFNPRLANIDAVDDTLVFIKYERATALNRSRSGGQNLREICDIFNNFCAVHLSLQKKPKR